MTFTLTTITIIEARMAVAFTLTSIIDKDVDIISRDHASFANAIVLEVNDIDN